MCRDSSSPITCRSAREADRCGVLATRRSGNPGRRPAIVKNIQELARAHTADAIAVLVAALKEPKERVAAATALLDRGYGRPVQTHNVLKITRIGDLTDEELDAIAANVEREKLMGETRH
jgi:hypothetical protein